MSVELRLWGKRSPKFYIQPGCATSSDEMKATATVNVVG
jgi:hypothetical protein